MATKKYLWYDNFKDGRTILNAPPKVLQEENELAWSTNEDDTAIRFDPVIGEHDEMVRGAVVQLMGWKDYEEAVNACAQIPWVVHGFAEGEVIPYGNFTSVKKLFHQNGRYKDMEPVKRAKDFSGNPNVSWVVILLAKDDELASYDEKYGLEDAVLCFRLWKG